MQQEYWTIREALRLTASLHNTSLSATHTFRRENCSLLSLRSIANSPRVVQLCSACITVGFTGVQGFKANEQTTHQESEHRSISESGMNVLQVDKYYNKGMTQVMKEIKTELFITSLYHYHFFFFLFFLFFFF